MAMVRIEMVTTNMVIVYKVITAEVIPDKGITR